MNMDKAICTKIAEYYPYTAEDVYGIYYTLQSVDLTIKVLDGSRAAVMDPFEMAGIVAKGELSVDDLIR